MKQSDLKLFTHEELSYLTNMDLRMELPRLIEILKDDNRPIPVAAYEKLKKLYSEMATEILTLPDKRIRKLKLPSFDDVSTFCSLASKTSVFLIIYMIFFKTIQKY